MKTLCGLSLTLLAGQPGARWIAPRPAIEAWRVLPEWSENFRPGADANLPGAIVFSEPGETRTLPRPWR